MDGYLIGIILLDKYRTAFYYVYQRHQIYAVMIYKFIRYAGIIAAVMIFILPGCKQPDIYVQKAGGFAIYLVEPSVDTAQLAEMDVGSIPLEDMPAITMDDIISYKKETHEIELTASAYGRLLQMGVPVNGRPFVVCMNGEQVYAGAFWVVWSSLSFDGVVIMLPSLTDTATVQLALGYPDPRFFSGKDPRNNKKILKSLELAGKLKQEKA